MISTLDGTDVEKRLSLLQQKYRSTLESDPLHARGRHGSRINLLYRPEGTLVDLGGGISIHNGVLAQLGMKVHVVDLLGEYWEQRPSDPSPIDQEVVALEQCGVKFIRREVADCDLTHYFAENSVDAVTSFHCLEHLHQSPKLVLESAMRVLKPGGTVLLEVPNAANLRKRIGLLLGHTNYLPYSIYYNSADYHGHIREYVADDLRQLARNLGMQQYRIFGTNTYAGQWLTRFPEVLRKPVDSTIRLFPGLCGALCLHFVKR